MVLSTREARRPFADDTRAPPEGQTGGVSDGSPAIHSMAARTMVALTMATRTMATRTVAMRSMAMRSMAVRTMAPPHRSREVAGSLEHTRQPGPMRRHRPCRGKGVHHPGCSPTHLGCSPMHLGCSPMHPRLQPHAPPAAAPLHTGASPLPRWWANTPVHTSPAPMAFTTGDTVGTVRRQAFSA